MYSRFKFEAISKVKQCCNWQYHDGGIPTQMWGDQIEKMDIYLLKLLKSVNCSKFKALKFQGTLTICRVLNIQKPQNLKEGGFHTNFQTYSSVSRSWFPLPVGEHLNYPSISSPWVFSNWVLPFRGILNFGPLPYEVTSPTHIGAPPKGKAWWRDWTYFIAWKRELGENNCVIAWKINLESSVIG